MVLPFFRSTSLQNKMAFLISLPVVLLLIVAGIIGYLFAHNILLEQWRQAAILELQHEAHQVDMLLGKPRQWIETLNRNTENNRAEHHIQAWIISRLRDMESVERVDLNWNAVGKERMPRHRKMMPMRNSSGSDQTRVPEAMRFHRARITNILPPRYDPVVDRKTVSLVSALHDDNDREMGSLEVVMRFDTLFVNLQDSGIWQTHNAYLVDQSGKVLFNRFNGVPPKTDADELLLDTRALGVIAAMPYGTIIAQGPPPKKVIGFYRLMEVPWTLVMVAPADEILSPIHQFGWYYLIFGSVFIGFALLLIRWVTGHTVASIKSISKAAHNVAQGEYSLQLPVKSDDEVGELTRNFNTMTRQLEDRMRLKEAMHLAQEVQQNLIPSGSLHVGNLQISGRSIYCDETGGDFYDFLQFPEFGSGKLGIAVGDVVGHGVAAALLMTTARALLRSAAAQTRNLATMATHVNRMLCMDTADTGNFMTLFYMVIDSQCGIIRWVRAGHDPAIIYDPHSDTFHELNGNGIALGVDENWAFEEYRFEGLTPGMTTLIGTDGIWETENEFGEKFGKQRIKNILREHWRQSPEEIVTAVLKAIDDFRVSVPRKDDVTLVIFKNNVCSVEQQDLKAIRSASG